MFLLAHLSDPHLASDLRLGARDIVSKRLWGFLSWRLRRRHIHRLTILGALAADIALQRPDHVVVTGDITNISLPAEFLSAARWLACLGDPHDVSAIPGNHDAYVPVAWERSWMHWHAYMRSDTDAAAATDPGLPAKFPFLRRRDNIAIIGLSTAVTSAAGMAIGRLGAAQIAATKELLDQLRAEGAFRVVLIHHPPITAPGDYHKRLTDAPAFMAMLMETGAELVLHGHDHLLRLRSLPSRLGEIAAVGAASASAAQVRGHAPAQYNLYRIVPCDRGWIIEACVRGLDDGGRFVVLQQHRLAVPREHARHGGDVAAMPLAIEASEG